MKLLYGTGNQAKLSVMRSRLEKLGIELIGLNDLRQEGKYIPDVVEAGSSPLENARLKALAYYQAFQMPVFSCDSGLYFDNVPDEIQPGVHVRNVNGKCLSDEKMQEYYGGLAKKHGNLVAQYRNAICFVMDEERIYEAMDESLYSEKFILTDKPHSQIRKKGFPLDSMSIDIRTNKYYYDMTDEELDQFAVEDGFLYFFKKVIPMTNKLTTLQPWEYLMKKIVWKQLGDIRDKKILDFGSGTGVTANYLAERNEVIAIEPDKESVKERWQDNPYTQIVGSTKELCEFPDETFDMIICHNVLEYAPDREEIVNEFARILKPNGRISLVKHNRAGRVMQMVVLLNDFDHAHSLLDGCDSTASKYGAIRYYEDEDIEKWCPNLKITKTLGMRTFWDMQQNQEIHKDSEWQNKMIEMEMRVSDMDGYRDIAFFHHLTIEKNRDFVF